MIQLLIVDISIRGFFDPLSAAGEGGKGSIINALKGGETKEAIYLYKFLFEALLRCKVKHSRSTKPDITSDINSA